MKSILQNKLILSIVFSIIGNVIAWIHMNAQFKWDWAKGPAFITLVGIPVSWCFYYATKYSVEYFGKLWNMRMIGFGIGTLIFGILTWIYLSEIPSLKIVISLLMAFAIILLQLTNI